MDIKYKVEQRFKCRTPQGSYPRPDKIDPRVYSHHASYVENGWRIWGFVTEDGRDAFMKNYPMAEYVM